MILNQLSLEIMVISEKEYTYRSITQRIIDTGIEFGRELSIPVL